MNEPLCQVASEGGVCGQVATRVVRYTSAHPEGPYTELVYECDTHAADAPTTPRYPFQQAALAAAFVPDPAAPIATCTGCGRPTHPSLIWICPGCGHPGCNGCRVPDPALAVCGDCIGAIQRQAAQEAAERLAPGTQPFADECGRLAAVYQEQMRLRIAARGDR